MNHHAYHDRHWSIAIATLLLLLFFAPTAAALNTDKPLYAPGDTVLFSSENLPGNQLLITTANTSYHLLDSAEKTARFMPVHSGTYAAVLTNIDGVELERTTFAVAHTLTVATDKPAYVAAEEIIITLTGAILPEHNLRILSDADTYQFLELRHSLSFIPRQEGNYTILLLYRDSIIYRTAFSVSSAPERPLIFTDADAYTISDTVHITIAHFPPQAQLLVTSPTSRYLFTNPSPALTFQPSAAGLHTLQLLSAQALVAEHSFTVLPPLTSHAPAGSNQLALRNVTASFATPVATTLIPVTIQDVDGATTVHVLALPNATGNFSFNFTAQPFQQVSLYNVHFGEGVVSVASASVQAPKHARAAYAISTSHFTFTSATLTARAQGTHLYVCSPYDFSSYRCPLWMLARTITPGEPYTVSFDAPTAFAELTPPDPLTPLSVSAASVASADSPYTFVALPSAFLSDTPDFFYEQETRVSPLHQLAPSFIIISKTPAHATLTHLLPAGWAYPAPKTANTTDNSFSLPLDFPEPGMILLSYNTTTPPDPQTGTFTTTLSTQNNTRSTFTHVLTDDEHTPFLIIPELHIGETPVPSRHLATELPYTLSFSITQQGNNPVMNYPVFFTWSFTNSSLRITSTSGCNNQQTVLSEKTFALQCSWQPFNRAETKKVSIDIIPLTPGIYHSTLNVTYDPPRLPVTLLHDAPYHVSFSKKAYEEGMLIELWHDANDTLPVAASTDVTALLSKQRISPHERVSVLIKHYNSEYFTLTVGEEVLAFGTAPPNQDGDVPAARTFPADLFSSARQAINSLVRTIPLTRPVTADNQPAEIPPPRTEATPPQPVPKPTPPIQTPQITATPTAAALPAESQQPLPSAKEWFPTLKHFVFAASNYTPPLAESVLFNRTFTCSECSTFTVPAHTPVTVTISATNFKPTSNLTLTDFYPSSWTVLDTADGVFSKHNTTHHRIDWTITQDAFNLSKAYTLRSPSASRNSTAFISMLATTNNSAQSSAHPVFTSSFSLTVQTAKQHERTHVVHIARLEKETKHAIIADVSVNTSGEIITKIELHDAVLSKERPSAIRFDDTFTPTGELSGKNVVSLYAIDASALNFSSGLITAVAKGTRLLKCTDWLFDEQRCPGSWEALMNLTPGQEYSVSFTASDPAWAEEGLVVINTHKSIYLPGELAQIAIGVLDKAGHVVCDANVTLVITTPSGNTTFLRTADGTISVSKQCKTLGATSEPDYFTNYTVQESGSYTMNLTAVTADGSPFMLTPFSVKDSVAFDAERIGPTRIYPLAAYNFTLHVLANTDFAGNITETVPASFTISDTDAMILAADTSTTLLVWNASFAAGQYYDFSYQFDAPDISPYRFELGPLTIGNFSEERTWQIASDAIAAGEQEALLLRTQQCTAMINSPTADTFTSSCDGTYPGACSSTADLVSCNDNNNEVHSRSRNRYAGVNITSYNTTINDCGSITSVRICYEEWATAGDTLTSCLLSVDATRGTSWSTVAGYSCPGTSANPGIVCMDATSLEAWDCSTFFGAGATGASAKLEHQRTSTGGGTDHTIDVLYFNVTYALESAPPNNSILRPLPFSNISGIFLVNASVNDSASGTAAVKFSVLQPGITAAGPISLSLSSGSAAAGYWNATFNSASVADGRYNVSVNATDAAGNANLSANVSVLIDNTLPNASILNVPNGTNISAALFPISLNANDTPAGVLFVDVLFRSSSGNSGSRESAALQSGTIYNGIWQLSYSTPSAEDTYNITVFVNDTAKNALVRNLSTVVIDKTLPNASTLMPAISNISGTLAVQAAANDSNTGIAAVSFYLANATNQTSREQTSLSSGTLYDGTWSSSYNTAQLAEGRYNITINATDFAGNKNFTHYQNFSVAVDRTPPAVSIITPLLHSNRSTAFLINASAVDGVSAVFNVSFRLINSTHSTLWLFATLGTGNANNGYWNATLQLLGIADGRYNVTVNATDFAGNQYVQNLSTVTVDTGKANISMIEPLNDTEVSGTILINASANDSLSRVAAVSFRVVGQAESSDWFSATLSIGTIAAGFWDAPFNTALLSNGNYNITMNTTDFAGNENVLNLSAILLNNVIDIFTPNASIVTPAAFANISGSMLVNASVNDSSGTIAAVNATLLNRTHNVTGQLLMSLGAGDIAVGYWNVSIGSVSFPDGRYNLSVNATDASGNANTSLNVSITIDNTFSNVTAIAPANGSVFADEQFLINSSVNDSPSGVISAHYSLINNTHRSAWLVASMGAGSIFAGYWNSTLSSSSFANGNYNLTANTTDFAGNMRLINVSFIVIANFVPDTVKPNASILSPAAFANISGSMLINASLNDSENSINDANVSLLRAGSTLGPFALNLSAGSLLSGYFAAAFSSTDFSDARYNVSVNATDAAGNTNISANRSIVIDNTAPNSSLVLPLNNTNVSGTFNANASANDSLSGVLAVSFRLMNSTDAASWTAASLTAGSMFAGYWIASIPVSPLAEGLYNVTANATDFAGAYQLRNISFLRIDKTPPNTSIVVPVNNTNVSANFLINASLNDSSSGVASTAFRLINTTGSSSWNSASLSAGTIAAGYWNATFPVSGIADGRYNLSVNATDTAGNSLLFNISRLTVDKTPPNSTLLTPANNSLQAGILLINASVNDSLSTVAAVLFKLTNTTGAAVSSWLTATRSSGTAAVGYWNASIDTTTLPNGVYNLTVNATDFAGASAVRNLSTFTIQNIFIAAGENGNTLLRAQSCNAEDFTVSQTFSLACAGTYPAACPADRLSCNDGTAESVTLSSGEYGGVNITSYNNTVVNCKGILSVQLCHKWYTSTDRTYANCQIGTDLAGDLSWNTALVSCPTTASQSIVCTDVNALESWSCTTFFGAAPAAWAHLQGQRTQSGPDHTLNIDALYFNISYTATIPDITPPNASITAPLPQRNISGSMLVNASLNDTGLVSTAQLIISNTTSNVTAFVPLSLGTGTVAAGFWNATFNTASLNDDYYNLSVLAKDTVQNSKYAANVSVTVDNTKPNSSVVSVANDSNILSLFLINASVNDSLSAVFNVTFRLANPLTTTAWIFASLSSGSISTGYWNASFAISTLQPAAYNITVNATDFANNQLLANISRFFYDPFAPNLSITQPAGAHNASGFVVVNASVNESVSNVSNVRLTLYNHTGNVSTAALSLGTGTVTIGYWNLTLDTTLFADARYNFSINATDFLGSSNISGNRSLVIDNTQPNASAIFPLNATNVSGTFLINASANDTLSGVRTVLLRLARADAASPIFATTLTTGTLASGFWSATFDSTSIADGRYNITVNATDFAGNRNFLNSSDVIVDNLAPNIAIVTPANSSILNSSFLVNASVNDSLSTVRSVFFRFTNSSGNATAWISATRNSGTASVGYWNMSFAAAQLRDGRYNITANATDFAGTQAVANISAVIIDTSLPDISFFSPTPANGSHLNQSWLFINASINESNVKNVTFLIANSTFSNQTSLLAGNTSINFTSLADGQYFYNVTVLDLLNLTASTDTRLVTLDNRKPNVTLLFPPNNSMEASNNVVILSYNVTDSNAISGCDLIINKNIQETSGAVQRNFTQSFTTSLANGIYNWSVNCTDLASNTAPSETRNLSVNVQAPSRRYTEFKSGTQNSTVAEAINLSFFNDTDANSVVVSTIASGTQGLLLNATLLNRSEYGQHGMLILASSTILFGGWFDTEHVAGGVPIWNLTKTNATGSFRLCSVESSTAYPKDSPTLITDSCVTPAADVRIEPSENLTLQVLVRPNIGSKQQRHYYGAQYNQSAVRFSAYQLGEPQPNITAPITASIINENTTFVVSCNLTCLKEACLNTIVTVEYNNTNLSWTAVNASSGNILLNGSQQNPRILGTVRDTDPAQSVNFTLFASLPSENKLRCVADADYSPRVNGTAISSLTINDTIFPNVTLVLPLNDSNVSEPFVTFSYLPVENNLANCSLYGNFTGTWQLNQSNLTPVSGAANNFPPVLLTFGYYFWNVACTDRANHTAFAPFNSTFYIQKPDLTINSSSIVFSNTSPIETQNITINVTVLNRGPNTAKDFVVAFFFGNSSNNGALANRTVSSLEKFSTVVVNITYLARPGPNNIFVILDVNNSVNESLEDNNEANNTVHVVGYSFFFGNYSTITVLGTVANETFRDWPAINGSGNIFTVDADSTIDFTSLRALGRTVLDAASSNDFAEADKALNMTNFTDSLTLTYADGNPSTPRETATFTVFGNSIANVPVTNSTNNTNFRTGILWDTSKDSGDNEYDASDREPLLFIVAVDTLKPGRYGVYNYEIRVPTTLRQYEQPDMQPSLSFYRELI